MESPITEDLVAQWQRLMCQWESALAVYERAKGRPNTTDQKRDPSIETVHGHLNEIKRQMDALVAKGVELRRHRKIKPGGLLIGMIEGRADNSDAQHSPLRAVPGKRALSGNL